MAVLLQFSFAGNPTPPRCGCTHRGVLKRLLISFQVQLTPGSLEALKALPQQKHKGDNQRVRFPRRIGGHLSNVQPASRRRNKSEKTHLPNCVSLDSWKGTWGLWELCATLNEISGGENQMGSTWGR